MLSGILGYFKSEFKKKKEVVIPPITRSGRVQKSQKKKKKKKLLKDVFPYGFSICSDKKGGKSKWFWLFP